MAEKITTLKEAVKRFIHDGCKLAIAATSATAPMAICFEIIRQRKKHLTILTVGATEVVDMMVGAGCVSRIEAGYVASHRAKTLTLPSCIRRSIEKGIPHKIEIEDYSNLAMTLRFFAGALKLPFIPVRSIKGSDIIEKRWRKDKLAIIKSPFTDEETIVLPPCNPDVAIIHCQQSDSFGNAQRWGMIGADDWIAKSAKTIIVTVERIVSDDVVRRNPNITILPGFMVDAVIEVPWGAHWSACQGFYDFDFEFRDYYAKASETLETFEKFLDEWVYGVENFEEYIKKLGKERLERLAVHEHFYSLPIDYGYR